jgi:6-phosphogluconate dehydrogenase
MQMAMIGLGRMGFNMVKRLIDGGHECVVHDLSEAPIAALEAEGATGARSLEEVITAMQAPRHVWIMVPAAFVGAIPQDIHTMMGMLAGVLPSMDPKGDGWRRYVALVMDALSPVGASPLPPAVPMQLVPSGKCTF